MVINVMFSFYIIFHTLILYYFKKTLRSLNVLKILQFYFNINR